MNEYIMKPEIVKSLYKDKYSHSFSVAKCPYCYNFFLSREDSIKSGNTKSCGCLKTKHAKEMGEANKKKNSIYYPLGCDYGICYYDNYDGYFIFDIDKKDIVENHHWTASVKKNRVTPVATIDGKIVLLSRYLMNTPEDMECDHINHNVSDVRICNLRNCSKIENLYNQSKGQGKVTFQDGKYVIANFSKEDTSGFVFDTEAEAQEKLYELQDIYYGEFSYRRSQQMAKENETNQFVKRFHYLGILEEIDNLPQKNIYKIILTNIERNKLNGIISEEHMTTLYLKLIDDYKMWKRENVTNVG